jgi:hypothetical protein
VSTIIIDQDTSSRSAGAVRRGSLRASWASRGSAWSVDAPRAACRWEEGRGLAGTRLSVAHRDCFRRNGG